MSRLLHCAVVFALGTAGCAADAADPAEGAEVQVQSRLSELVAEERDDTYFAEVRANGTGCPEGTWNTEISEDGKVFTTTFNRYESSVDEWTGSMVKQCQLQIRLHSRSGFSYAVTSFSYSGYAFLEEGVSARLSARYYFQGNSLGPDSNRQTMWGPRDDSYVFTDTIETRDWVWSPCGVDRELNIPTTLTVNNNDTGRSGYANLGAVDGRTESRLIFELTWRRCD